MSCCPGATHDDGRPEKTSSKDFEKSTPEFEASCFLVLPQRLIQAYAFGNEARVEFEQPPVEHLAEVPRYGIRLLETRLQAFRKDLSMWHEVVSARRK